ncbi:MAG: ABC transporter ATP-binding protein [Candidatus Bathyarchaeota archaeon]|nr:MAG: ABC transporter ATP-binding protein [Candidatus Bathyarchaeota archaeon]
MTVVRLEDVSKRYGEVEAVKGFTCEIRDGEFMVLVGPSGCGKTTLLRLILGDLTPDNGHIYMDNTIIDDVPIEERNIGFLPQDFGLFPHLTVWKNISYGLKIRGDSDRAIHEKTEEMLRILDLQDLKDRSPRQLSWGQQQRTALARALVIQPNLLLLDEPLSAVDWITREEIAEGVKKLQAELKITTLYVTHDISEALSLGHRVIVMYKGRLEQCDKAEKLINKPKTKFVRRFIRSDHGKTKL